ncbi:hypothetical protein VTK56DRAFT_2687 [Thermocarpiscus australiensis]
MDSLWEASPNDSPRAAQNESTLFLSDLSCVPDRERGTTRTCPPNSSSFLDSQDQQGSGSGETGQITTSSSSERVISSLEATRSSSSSPPLLEIANSGIETEASSDPSTPSRSQRSPFEPGLLSPFFPAAGPAENNEDENIHSETDFFASLDNSFDHFSHLDRIKDDLAMDSNNPNNGNNSPPSPLPIPRSSGSSGSVRVGAGSDRERGPTSDNNNRSGSDGHQPYRHGQINAFRAINNFHRGSPPINHDVFRARTPSTVPSALHQFQEIRNISHGNDEDENGNSGVGGIGNAYTQPQPHLFPSHTPIPYYNQIQNPRATSTAGSGNTYAPQNQASRTFPWRSPLSSPTPSGRSSRSSGNANNTGTSTTDSMLADQARNNLNIHNCGVRVNRDIGTNHGYNVNSDVNGSTGANNANANANVSGINVNINVAPDAVGYCLVRPNGTRTRLVPVDMLPVVLQGIPARENDNARLIELPTPQGLGPDGRSSNTQPLRSVFTPGPNANNNNTLVPTNNKNNRQLARREKVYCDKWVHEGVCAFTQQGCKYKHEMPLDTATQHALGLFHGLPAWYKRAQAELARRQVQGPVQAQSQVQGQSQSQGLELPPQRMVMMAPPPPMQGGRGQGEQQQQGWGQILGREGGRERERELVGLGQGLYRPRQQQQQQQQPGQGARGYERGGFGGGGGAADGSGGGGFRPGGNANANASAHGHGYGYGGGGGGGARGMGRVPQGPWRPLPGQSGALERSQQQLGRESDSGFGASGPGFASPVGPGAADTARELATFRPGAGVGRIPAVGRLAGAGRAGAADGAAGGVVGGAAGAPGGAAGDVGGGVSRRSPWAAAPSRPSSSGFGSTCPFNFPPTPFGPIAPPRSGASAANSTAGSDAPRDPTSSSSSAAAAAYGQRRDDNLFGVLGSDDE